MKTEIYISDKVWRRVKKSKGFSLYINKLLKRNRNTGTWLNTKLKITDVSTQQFSKNPYVWVVLN